MRGRLRLLGICGSPRRGNSQFLLEAAIKAATENAQFEVDVSLGHLKPNSVAPCDACGWHERNNGECRIKDAFQNLRDRWLEADIVLYAFPVYHMGIPAQLKAFIDRLGSSLGAYFTSPEPRGYYLPRLLKAVGLITQGAHRFGGQDLALNYMLNHVVVMRCLPVPGEFPMSYVGAAGWTGGRLDKSGLAKLFSCGDEDARAVVEAAKQIGRRSVQLSMILRDGVRANQQMLSHDPGYEFFLEKAARRTSVPPA